MARLELRLLVPRWQRVLAWGLAVVYLLAACFALRLVQGMTLQPVCLRLDAKILRLNGGLLTVTTQFRKPFGRARLILPMGETALEGIGPALVIQEPGTGGLLRLGSAPTARATADRLVGRGAPQPVGG